MGGGSEVERPAGGSALSAVASQQSRPRLGPRKSRRTSRPLLEVRRCRPVASYPVFYGLTGRFAPSRSPCGMYCIQTRQLVRSDRAFGTEPDAIYISLLSVYNPVLVSLNPALSQPLTIYYFFYYVFISFYGLDLKKKNMFGSETVSNRCDFYRCLGPSVVY